tara:strand:+ start:1507 stop:2727 length:1221 start_codon:yes stop_codon:yes gene_type:complete
MATGMGGQPQPQPKPSPQGQSSPSMNMNVSPEKRNALKNYLEGYKDAIQKKTMDQLLPNISTPQMPMQQPMQQPMMMNMGGAVDVFEPQYMRNGGVTVGSNFTNKDLKGDRNRKDSIDKVIDILDERSAPVNVGMMPERRGDITIPMEESTYVPFDNIIQRDRTMGQTTDLNYQMDPQDNLGSVQSPYATFNPDSANFSDFMSGDVNPISKDVSGYYRSADDFAPPEEYFDEGFMKSQKSMFAPFVNKIGMGIMGYSDPYELYKATQATLDDESTQSSIARDRLKDQERAERKLAEEQRMRAMIQSMLPPAVETVDPTETTAPIADVITPTEPTSPVVESTRVPDFTIPALPSLPATSPLLPPGISPELLRNLFKLQGVPATQMNQGGSVNKLDTAVDNFLSAVRQ